MNDLATVHARWHRALDDPTSESPGPIRDHIEQVIAEAEARGADRVLAEFSDGAADDRGPENSVPTAPQLLRRFLEATTDERLALFERALVNSEKAHNCFLMNHRGRVRQLEREIVVLLAALAEHRKAGAEA